MPSQQNLVRDQRAGDLLEMMLVFAVATILVIGALLALTGCPQLGGGGLHIAHMLWGGGDSNFHRGSVEHRHISAGLSTDAATSLPSPVVWKD